MRIGNVGGIVIKCRQAPNDTDHNGHRVGVAAKTGIKPAHLLMQHRVIGHTIVEILLLRWCRQFAVKEQVAGLEEIAVFGELIDRVSAIKKRAFITINEGDVGFAACRGGEPRIVCERA